MMTARPTPWPDLHGSYTRWWLATIVPALVADLLGWTLAVAVLLSVAALVEIIAIVVRRRLGDTLSEHLWALVRRWPATVPPTIGLAVWLVWTALRLLPATAPYVTEWPPVGLFAFAAGALGWLLIHVLFLGRYG